MISVALAASVSRPGATFQAAGETFTYEVLAEIGPHGSAPFGGVIKASDGFYYGTTVDGGDHGGGVVYRMTADGSITVIHHFEGGAGGDAPHGELVEGDDGKLYGTTSSGGNQFNWGTVFTVDPATGAHHALDTVYPEGNCTAVNVPLAGLTKGPGGLYGIGNGVGCNNSPAFRVTPEGRIVPVVMSPQPGRLASAGLLLASDNALYGTFSSSPTSFAAGAVFRMALSGVVEDSWIFSRINTSSPFLSGANPQSELVEGIDGSIYGTTANGGGDGSQGVLFRVVPFEEGIEVLHRFPTESSPKAGLTRGHDGAIYGTTTASGMHGHGTLFRYTADGDFQILHHFAQETGSIPEGRLLEDSPGVFIGTTSAGGDTGHGVVYRLTIAPSDTTAPVLNLPDDIVIDSTDPAGVAVPYTVTADDETDPHPVVTCWPPSGTVVLLGETVRVECKARDASNNESTGSFTITVRDARGVVWTLDYPVFVEATGPAGAVVEYTVSVSGAVPPNPAITCSTPSGTVVGLGPEEITCTTVDVNGDTAMVSFTVTVRDSTPPKLTVPSGLTIDPFATRVVPPYTVTAVDLVDPAPVVSCAPLPGSSVSFGIDVVVTCTATDRFSNAASASFTIDVLSLSEIIEQMIRIIEALDLERGLKQTLVHHLQSAAANVERPHGSPCPHLNVFEAQLAAARHTGKIPASVADPLAQTASNVWTRFGCRHGVLQQ